MSTLERLNLEKEHVGLYLSAHPLDDYKLQLKYACNTRMNELESIPRPRGREEAQQKLAELEQRPEEMERIRQIQSREIICGGLVTGWREGVSQKGNTYGVLTVEDYSGKHDFPLFGESYPAFRGYGKEGMFILIHAKYMPGKFQRTPPRTIFDLNFEILKIEQLDLVADKLIEDFTVRVDSLKITDQIVHMLQSELLAKPDNSIAQKPASTLLYFEVCDAIKNYNVRLFCREHKVRVSNELVEYVRSLDGVECSINGHLVVDERTTAEEEEDDGIVDESADLLSDD